MAVGWGANCRAGRERGFKKGGEQLAEEAVNGKGN